MLVVVCLQSLVLVAVCVDRCVRFQLYVLIVCMCVFYVCFICVSVGSVASVGVCFI